MVAKLHGEGAHQSLRAMTELMKVHIRQCFCIEALYGSKCDEGTHHTTV